MNRIGIFFCLGICLPGIGAAPGHGQAAGGRPNLVFLLTDDHRWDALGVMGHPIIKTPELDRLAGEGVLFRNAYVTTAICFASRASLFLSQYQTRHGLADFAAEMSEAQQAGTFHALLRKAGYRTGYVGKWHVGSQNQASRFDFWDGYWASYEIKTGGVVTGHLTDHMGDRALDFLRTTARTQPFLLTVSFKAPHAQDEDPRQFIPAPRFAGLYAKDSIPVPPTGEPAFFQSLPAFLRDPRSEMRLRWNLRFSGTKLPESTRNYYRLITGVDEVVGRIRSELARMGAAENTVIVFMGDNGMFLGERGYADKWLPYEPSIRVPLILYDPALPARLRNQGREEMVLNIDIAPTLLSLAGLPIPASMQGNSLLPLARAERTSWRSEFYYEHPWTNGAIPTSEALVGRRYKYIRYPGQVPAYEELYDYRQDPWERYNLVGSPAHKAALDSLRQRHAILKPSVAKDDRIAQREEIVPAGTTAILRAGGGKSRGLRRALAVRGDGGYDARGRLKEP